MSHARYQTTDLFRAITSIPARRPPQRQQPQNSQIAFIEHQTLQTCLNRKKTAVIFFQAGPIKFSVLF